MRTPRVTYRGPAHARINRPSQRELVLASLVARPAEHGQRNGLRGGPR